MGIIFGLVSSILFAIGFNLINKSAKSFPSSVAFLFDVIFGFLILVPLSIFLGLNINEISKVIPFALLSAVLSEAFVFFVLSKGEISLTGTIFATYSIYTVILSNIFLNEMISMFSGIMIITVILGTILTSIPKNFNKKELQKKAYIIWPLLGAIAVGISDTISKSTINKFSMSSFIFALAVCQLPVAFLYLLIEKTSLKKIINYIKDFKEYKIPYSAGLFNALGLAFLWLTFDITYASIASPLTGSYPVFMIILAFIFLKERPRKIEWIGIILTLIGIIGISLR